MNPMVKMFQKFGKEIVVLFEVVVKILFLLLTNIYSFH
jgi:hypothetical protein